MKKEKELKDPEELFKELGLKIDEEQNKKEWQAIKTTAAFKKIESYVMGLPATTGFSLIVKGIRERFRIPLNGFGYPKDYDEFLKINSKLEKGFFSEILKLSNFYGAVAFSEFFESYVLFGNTKAVADYLGATPMIEIEDIYSTFFIEKDEDDLKLSVKDKTELLISSSKTHPVCLMIHPYMSQRDIIDAIKKLYKLQIEPIQKKHQKDGVMLGKVRRKSSRVEERNKFIYENRNLKMLKLRTAIREKFGDIFDESYIYKIIKEERRKNK